MRKSSRRLLFDGAAPQGAIRLLSDRLDFKTLQEGQPVPVNLARVMSFKDHYYGKVELTRQKFNAMIKNFNDRVYGQDIFIDVSHAPSEGAAAHITKVYLDGLKFMGEAVFTPYGIDAVTQRGFRYLSIDFTEEYEDPETGKEHGPLLFGAGLTIRPRVKRLDPVTLSYGDDDLPYLLNLKAKKLLTDEVTTMWKEFLKKLQTQLSELKLSENVAGQFTDQFETTAKALGDNKEGLEAVLQAMIANAKALADAGKGQSDSIKLDFSSLKIQSAAGMDEDAVRKILAEEEEKKTKAAKKLAEDRQKNVDLFNKLLTDAEGLKSLSEDQRKELGEAADLITSDMSEDQVRKLAEHQIKLGDRLAVGVQLAGMGYQGPQGSPRISLDESNSIKQLDQLILSHLRQTSHHANQHLRLAEKLHPFVEKVLAEFDRQHAVRLHQESKLLSGGQTGIADTNLPVGFQRTVIREALSDLRVLELIQTLTDFGATATTQIPYETRDTSDVLNDGIVYEGGAIHRANVSQEMDLAYILPMKLAFLISNEVMHFSRASAINWDAYARNVESNARVMRELIVRRICNELQRSADAYGATAVANEDFGSQLDGATVSTIKTTNYPIVRPHQQKDLKGTNVGSAENPISIQINSVAILEYDGSGTQSAGTYYRVTNYNLGYIQFVDEAGTPVTPAATVNNEFISYSYATNVAKFDLDNGSVEIGLHLNGLLRTFGARKAVMAQDRFVMPNFMLMSYTLNNTATNANNFEGDSKRNGTDTTAQGDLETIKGIPAFSTNAPGVHLGDERAIIGERGVLTYTVAKPFVTGEPFEAVDSNGRAIGKKQAYGEEYSAIKVPTPIRNRLTSVLAYSFTGR